MSDSSAPTLRPRPGETEAAGSQWRMGLAFEARHRIVEKITETLKRFLPISGPEGLDEIYTVAVKFEDRVYNLASSQRDYLSKISMKMLIMVRMHAEASASGTSGTSAGPTNDNNPSQISQDPASYKCAATSSSLNSEVTKLRNAVENLTAKLDVMKRSNVHMKNILEQQQKSLVKQSRVIKKHRKRMDLLITRFRIPEASLSLQLLGRQQRLQQQRQQRARVRRRLGLQ